MPATPIKRLKTPPWMIDPETGARLLVNSEEEYLELMNAYMSEEYKGLSQPIIGNDIYALPDPVWALKNLIQEDGLTIIHGLPGSYKSFIAMDWAYSLSAPQSSGWMGQPRARQFRPMFLFTEGIQGLKNRSIAWSKERGLHTPAMDEAVVWVRDRVGLNATRDPDNPFTQQVASLVKMYNDYDCDILFVDTLANTFVGNENMQEDANSYLRTLSLFLKGGPVVLIHHNRRGDDEFRGSSVFHGAVDTLVSMKKTLMGAHLQISKQKDGPENFYLELMPKVHTWGSEHAPQSSIALTDGTADAWMKPVHEELLALFITHEELTVKHAGEILEVLQQTMKSRLDRLVTKGKLAILEDVSPATYVLNEVEEI